MEKRVQGSAESETLGATENAHGVSKCIPPTQGLLNPTFTPCHLYGRIWSMSLTSAGRAHLRAQDLWKTPAPWS